jgi:hypothetical protein
MTTRTPFVYFSTDVPQGPLSDIAIQAGTFGEKKTMDWSRGRLFVELFDQASRTASVDLKWLTHTGECQEDMTLDVIIASHVDAWVKEHLPDIMVVASISTQNHEDVVSCVRNAIDVVTQAPPEIRALFEKAGVNARLLTIKVLNSHPSDDAKRTFLRMKEARNLFMKDAIVRLIETALSPRHIDTPATPFAP